MAAHKCALVVSAADPARHFDTVEGLAEHILDVAGRRQLIIKPVQLSVARLAEDVHCAAALGVYAVTDGRQDLIGYALVGLPPLVQAVQKDLLKAALLAQRSDVDAAA